MESTRIRATIVADSINQWNHRITTLLLVMPRIILAEFNTHRMFSRNAASSRAIPFHKMIQTVEKDPFIPITWLRDHKGMQGSEELDISAKQASIDTWLQARDKAVYQAKILNERYNLTKQLCNRLLEPFSWVTVLCTATEWENFFALRFNPAAEIHMQVLAAEMLQAMNESEPKSLSEGEWHLPFREDLTIDGNEVVLDTPSGQIKMCFQDFLIKVSIARAARTSYTLPDSEAKNDYVKDIGLADSLEQNGHWSPFEHCAQCPTEDEYFQAARFDITDPFYCTQWREDGDTKVIMETNYDLSDCPNRHGWFGNFRGWKQYRKLHINENRSDSRLIKKQFVQL